MDMKLSLLQDLLYVLTIIETAEKMEKEIWFSVVKSRISNCGYQLRDFFMDVDSASSLWPHMKEGLSGVFDKAPEPTSLSDDITKVSVPNNIPINNRNNFNIRILET